MKRITPFFLTLLATATVACISSSELRRREYDYQYQQAMKLCGYPDAAFQAGYNAGYGGSRMNGEWASMCVPEARAESSAAYQRGFIEGANNAPLRVVHTITPRSYPASYPASRPATSATAYSECTFDSDCGGDGWHCRNHTCMGYGGVGERCVFNSDCLTDSCLGGTCRE